MKFLPIALLALGATAQSVIEPIEPSGDASAPAPSASAPSTGGSSSSSCEADYIVERCLSTETKKTEACEATDYDCQCAAYEAIATCYNNCPNDPRASSAQNQVLVFCQQASLHGTQTKASATEGTSTQTEAPATTGDDENDDSEESGSVTAETDLPQETGAAGEVFVNAGGALVAVAGAIVALL